MLSYSLSDPLHYFVFHPNFAAATAQSPYMTIERYTMPDHECSARTSLEGSTTDLEGKEILSPSNQNEHHVPERQQYPLSGPQNPKVFSFHEDQVSKCRQSSPRAHSMHGASVTISSQSIFPWHDLPTELKRQIIAQRLSLAGPITVLTHPSHSFRALLPLLQTSREICFLAKEAYYANGIVIDAGFQCPCGFKDHFPAYNESHRDSHHWGPLSAVRYPQHDLGPLIGKIEIRMHMKSEDPDEEYQDALKQWRDLLTRLYSDERERSERSKLLKEKDSSWSIETSKKRMKEAWQLGLPQVRSVDIVTVTCRTIDELTLKRGNVVRTCRVYERDS